MNNPDCFPIFKCKPRPAAGAALILTLGMLVLLFGLVLAFLLTVRTEFGASKAYEGGTNARLLADSALNLVIGQIREGSTQPKPNQAWISQPGLIRTFDTDGKPVKSYKLYSADSLVEGTSFNPADANDLPATNVWKKQPGLWTDINAPVADLTRKNPIDANKPMMTYPIFDGTHLKMATDLTLGPGKSSLQFSLNNDGVADIEGFKVEDKYADGGASMPVKWLYMLKDGTLVPAKASGSDGDVEVLVPAGKKTTAQGDFNGVVARIAFWTDDETAKVNINTASEGTFADLPMSFSNPGTTPETSFTGSNPDATFEWELAWRQAASKEYQRFPGHPATTCLSTIFGRQLLLRSDIAGNRAKMAEEIFKFIPRVSGAEYNPGTDPDLSLVVKDNSSKAGTVRGGGVNGISTFNPLTPDGDRLYATIDEFIYNPNFATGDTVTTKRYGWTLAPPVVGRDTTREMVDLSRFFLTANSKAPEQNLSNLPRISIWPEMMLPADQFAGKIDRRTPFDKLIAFCATVGDKDPQNATSLTSPHLPFYFTRQSSGSCGMLLDVAGNPTGIDPKGDLAAGLSPARPSRNLYLMDYLRELTKSPIPGWDTSASSNPTFKTKYGADNDQILTEIFDYIRSTNLVDRTGSPQSLTRVPPAVKSVNDSPYSYTQTTPKFASNYTDTATAIQFVVAGQVSNGIPQNPVFNPDTLRTTTAGEVVPIRMANVNNVADDTRGIGRFPTISEVALIVTRLPDTDPPMSHTYITGQDPTTFPAYGTMTAAQKAYLPNCYAGAASGFPGWNGLSAAEKTYFDTEFKKIGTLPSPNALLQFALVPNLFGPMAGYCANGQGFRVTFSNVVMNVKVVNTATGTQLPRIMPAATDDVFSGIPPKTIGAVRGIDSLFGMDRIEGQKWGGTYGLNTLTWATGTVPPWASMIVPLSIAPPDVPKYVPSVNASRWENRARATIGEIAPGPLIDKLRAVYKSPNNLEISCTATITITGPTGPAGAPTTTNTTNEPVIQTLSVNFPKFSAPIPILNPIPRTTLQTIFNGPYIQAPNPPQDESFDAAGKQNAVGVTNNVWTKPWIYLVDPNTNKPGGKLQNSSTIRLATNRALDSTERDVVRTIALTGNGSGVVPPAPLTTPGIQGDVRIIAAKRDIPASYFQISDPDFYSNPNVYTGKNSMRTAGDHMKNSSQQYYGERKAVFGALVKGKFGANSGDLTNDPVKGFKTDPNKGYGMSAIPSTERVNGVSTPINGVNNYLGQPGDWDTGPFWMADGPYCNKADEGTLPFRGKAPYGLSDSNGNFALQTGFEESQTFFSPNRQIPSPVMFGSLPTGVKSDRPWQTLLFRPAKTYFPGGTTHPGSAASGPPDHLLLDLFWMPVVEPYAISEPFATAGKINLNQQIAPFINIRRDTALRAVMKSVKMSAIDPDQLDSNNRKLMVGYKEPMNTPSAGVVNRRSIDLDNTLKQISDRLDRNKPFVSASEICDIPLIPQDLPPLAVLNALPGVTNMKAHVSAGFSPNTALGAFDGLLSTFWGLNTYTGDNLLERPYALIYPRLTTRSNSYTVHVRVQTLPPNGRGNSYIIKASQNQPTSEFRGSFVLERYLDPNTAGIYAATDTTYTTKITGTIIPGEHVLGPYRFRVVSSKQFAP